MKKILTALAISIFVFNFAFAESETDEVIGVDHETGIIAGVVEDAREVYESVFGWFDDITKRGVEEVEHRQEIIEEQVETRKENLFISIKNSLQEFVNSVVESILDSLMAPFEGFIEEGGEMND